MAELKTRVNDASVTDFLNAIDDEQRRQDCFTIVTMMGAATGEEPQMWGGSIVGFGSYHYVGASGREGDWFVVGVSPRKQNLTLYIIAGFDHYLALLSKLGKYKTGKSCLYVKRLADIDIPTLTSLIEQSVQHMRATHPSASVEVLKQ